MCVLIRITEKTEKRKFGQKILEKRQFSIFSVKFWPICKDGNKHFSKPKQSRKIRELSET